MISDWDKKDVREAVGGIWTHVIQKNIPGIVYLQWNILYPYYFQTVK